MNFEKIKNHSGSTLLISLIVLSIFLTIGMIVSNIIIKDISLNRDHGDSNYAYYAADMGLKKAIWLLNNEIFTNGHAWGDFYASGVDICPSAWDEETQECPCPVYQDTPACVHPVDSTLILDNYIYPNGPRYRVYMFLEYNSGANGLNRKLTLTSIGTYHNNKRKLEYSTCIGNMCK
ncbi:hypothetical protein HOC90_04160 [Candidatus Falkowbacteria bacterium]|jgi:hypothetical protein|nr:hypothetical protein [Elusimicrobiaceae bacterium]MBT4433510.1 hypothetical protein [Candidatus Falkowbacteria bacterium]